MRADRGASAPTPGEGLRAAARYCGGAALRRFRVPLLHRELVALGLSPQYPFATGDRSRSWWN
jgi:hypothetical protein